MNSFWKKLIERLHLIKKAWLKPCIDMNIKLRQKAKNNFEKDFSKFINNAVFGKAMENLRKHRSIKLVTTEKRRNYLILEQNYHTTKSFTKNLLAIEMRKTKILMNEPVYLGLSILDLSNTVTYEFWYDYVISKYAENTEVCYMASLFI